MRRQNMTDRLQKLQTMLQRSPRDPFLLYALALEHKKSGDAPGAIEWLDRVLEVDPNYCYAYHQKGLVYESQGDIDAARRAYRAGIDAAQRTGDAHAGREIGEALDVLGDDRGS
jgi:Tfp pilus assembly protein PilF